MYHIILLIEFLQVFFFVFYKISIVNEFMVSQFSSAEFYSNQQGEAQTTTNGNILLDPNYKNASTTINNTPAISQLDNYDLSDITDSTTQSALLPIADYLKYVNFPIIILEAGATNSFIVILTILNVTFIFTFAWLLLVANKYYQEQLNSGGLKDTQKLIVNMASVIVTIFLTIFQIPMLIILFQAFLCDENINEPLILDLVCGNSYQRWMISISACCFATFICFSMIEKMLYTSSIFDALLPWASLDSNVEVLKLILKLTLVVFMIFNKNGDIFSTGYLHMILSVLCFIIIYRRLTNAVILNSSVHYANMIYEMLLSWLFLSVSCHLLSGNALSVSSTALIIVIGVFLGVLLVLAYKLRHRTQLLDDKDIICQASPSDQTQYFFKLFHIIANSLNDKPNEIILNSLLANHMASCSIQSCQCRELVAVQFDQVAFIGSCLKELQEKSNPCSKNSKSDERSDNSSWLDNQLLKATTIMHKNEWKGPGITTKQSDVNISEFSGLKKIESLSEFNSVKENADKQPSNNDLPQSIKNQLLELRKRQKSIKSKSGTVKINPNLFQDDQTNDLKPPPTNNNNNFLISDNQDSSKLISFGINMKQQQESHRLNIEQTEDITYTEIMGSQSQLEQVKMPSIGSLGMALPLLKKAVQEQKFNQLDDIDLTYRKKPETLQKYWFRFLSLFVQQSVHVYPKCVKLRIINAFLQNAKLKNNFKAIFELMNCEQLEPSFIERFEMFRLKFRIEQQLVLINWKNAEHSGNIDAQSLFKYEKLFQKYSLLEYLAASATIKFWRELLKTNVNSKSIKIFGSEISSNFLKIEDIAHTLFKLNPNELQFIYRYALFLKQITSNDSEALSLFEKAYFIYMSIVNKKSSQNGDQEIGIFGENTSSAIVMMETTSLCISSIIHVNEQIYSILGYQPRELIGCNVQCLMPQTIGDYHDQFIIQYMETAKPHAINSIRHTFAITKEGHLRPVKLLIKIYPNIIDKILFVGMIQLSDTFEEIQQSTNIEPEQIADHQYIMTDELGNICSVTDGLSFDYGLNAKFFYSTRKQGFTITQFTINIGMLCPENQDFSMDEILENDGTFLTFDTRELLNHVDLETLAHEEIADIQTKLGINKTFVQMKRVQYQRAKMKIYLIYQMNSNQSCAISKLMSNRLKSTELAGGNNGSNNKFKQQHNNAKSKMELDEGGADQDPQSSVKSFELSSTNSTSNSGMGAFKSSLNDFKKALSERKSSKSLRRLNLIILLIVLAMILLACIEYAVNTILVTDLEFNCTHSLKSSQREITFILLITNLRTLINIANHLEPQKYEGEEFHEVDRFSFLSHQIQQQGEALQEIVDFIDSQRQDTTSFHPSKFMEFENTPVSLYRLDQNNKIFQYQQHYRQGFNTFLNFVLHLNGTTQSNLTLPGFLIRGTSHQDMNTVFSQTTSLERDASYLILNGYRNLLKMTIMANDLQQQLVFEDTSDDHFLIIMIVGIFVSTISLIVLFYHIVAIERVKQDIMSLLALLNINDVKNIFEECNAYLDKLDCFQSGTPLEIEESEALQSSIINSNLMSIMSTSQFFNFKEKDIGPAKFLPSAFQKQRMFGENTEEQKDEDAVKSNLLQMNRYKHYQSLIKRKNQRFIGETYYEPILKDIKEQIKGIFQREQSYQIKKDEAMRAKLKNDLEKQDSDFNSSSHKLIVNEESTNRELIDKNGEEHLFYRRGTHKRKKNTSKQQNSVAIEVSDQDSSISSHSQYGNERHLLRALSRSKKQTVKNNITIGESTQKLTPSEVIEHRKKMFTSQEQIGNMKLLIGCSVVCIILMAYFIFIFSFHEEQMNQIRHLKNYLPLFFDRYSNMVLAYGFLREKIINNNSLSSFNHTLEYFTSEHLDIEGEYKEQCLIDQKELEQEKSQDSDILKHLTALMRDTDSENFCQLIIGERDDNIDETSVDISVNSKASQRQIALLRKQAYNHQVQTVIAACIAAYKGDLEGMKQLHRSGVNLNDSNYDMRTPLHVACSYGKMEIVQFLVEVANVNVNPVDRWGATPLNDAQKYSDLATYLAKHGAIVKRTIQVDYQFTPSTNIDQYRLFYAAFYGDLEMMKNLKLLGWELNAMDFQGRTALQIASSQGQLQVVKFLTDAGADLGLNDAYDNDALSEAVRENRTATVKFLRSIINEAVIKHACSSYQQGILGKGIQQAFGIFLKKFEDVELAIGNTTNYHTILQYLNPEISADQVKEISKAKVSSFNRNTSNATDVFSLGNYSTTQRAMNTFISTQELYFHWIIDRIAIEVQDTTETFLAAFTATSESVFIAFLILQVLIIVILRSKMLSMLRREVFQSRGILNLVPWSFFEENKEAFQAIVTKLKD